METQIPTEAYERMPKTTEHTLPHHHLSISQSTVRGDKALGQIFHCSASTIRRRRDAGEIPFKQFGKVILFDLQEVLAAISNPKTVAP